MVFSGFLSSEIIAIRTIVEELEIIEENGKDNGEESEKEGERVRK